MGPWIYAGKAYDVAVSPTDPNTVYAANGSGGGLWKTSDGGLTWLQLTDRGDVTSIGCVSAHPSTPNVVVACIGGPGDSSTRRGLMYSADAGRHFDFIGPSDGRSTSFYRAIFDPNNPNIIYTASESGVYLTTDRGATWALILPFPGSNPDYFDHLPDLAMKPDNPSVLLAAQINLGVFRTADGGATWSRVDQAMDPTAQTTVVAWSPSNPNTVYCESNNTDGQHMLTYASADAGVTWSLAANLTFYHQDRYDMALTVDPTNSARVMLANGFFGISTDGLKTYTYHNSPHADHLRVVFAPSNPTIAYDANDGGVWRSTDAGSTWSRFDVGVNTNISFGFDVDTASGHMYLSPGDYGSFQYTPTAGWYSSPEGGEWSKFYVDPNDTASVWYASPGDLAVSRDHGLTWSSVDPDRGAPRPYRTVLRFDPHHRGTLFFLTNKVWVSRDSGATWLDLGVRSTVNYFSDMILDPARSGSIYLSDSGIFSSTDGGATWKNNVIYSSGLPGNPRIMAPAPGRPGEFYLTATGGVFYVTVDASGTVQSTRWLTASKFLDAVAINDIATDPAHLERIYVGTGAGLFFSQDYGQSWQRLGRNLPTNAVWQVSVKGAILYAGTDQGIWQFSSDVSWQPVPPANFAVTATSTSAITLSWAPGSNSTGVRIFRDGIQTYVGLERNFTDLNLTSATNYCYTALDSDSSGEGPLSSPICVSTLPASQTIAFGALRPVTLGVAPFTVSATASSGLAVTFTSTTTSVCTVSGSTVTALALGTCSITANQSGNSSYASATAVTQSFTVTGQACDLNHDGAPDAADVRFMINQALGVNIGVNDLTGDGIVNIVDVQSEVNATNGLGCTTT